MPSSKGSAGWRVQIVIIVLGEKTLRPRSGSFLTARRKYQDQTRRVAAVTARAQAIANIVMNQARLDGVQIDNADDFVCVFIKRKLFNLGSP